MTYAARVVFVVLLCPGCSSNSSSPNPTNETQRCLEDLDGHPQMTLRHGSNRQPFVDGVTAEFTMARQGVLHTPFWAQVGGLPELYYPLDDGGHIGQMIGRWSVTDTNDASVLGEGTHPVEVRCITDVDGNYLESEIHAQYIGEVTTTHPQMTPDELEGLDVVLSVEVGIYPGPDAERTYWGGIDLAAANTEFLQSDAVSFTLSQGAER